MSKETKVKETKQFKEKYELDQNALSYLQVNQVLASRKYDKEDQMFLAMGFSSAWNLVKQNSTLGYFFDKMLDCWQIVKYSDSNADNTSNSGNN